MGFVYVLIVVGLVVVAISIGFMIFVQNFRKDWRLGYYNMLAKQLNGDVLDERVQAILRGVSVTLDQYNTNDRFSPSTWDRATVYIANEQNKALDIYAKDTPPVDQLPDLQTVTLDHEGFDKQFTMRTNNPQWVHQIFTEDIRQLHLQHTSFHVVMTSNTLTVQRRELNDNSPHPAPIDLDTLTALMDLAALYAIHCDPSILPYQRSNQPEQSHNAW